MTLLCGCLEKSSDDAGSTKKSEPSDQKKNSVWSQAGTMGAGTANGSGTVAAPVQVSVPNYGGAASQLSLLVDQVATKVPAQPRQQANQTAQGFGQGGGLFGGGLLAGFGNLLFGLLGLGKQR